MPAKRTKSPDTERQRAAQQVKREQVLDELHKICNAWVRKATELLGKGPQDVKDASCHVFPYGSVLFGDSSADADVDLLLLVPQHIERERHCFGLSLQYGELEGSAPEEVLYQRLLADVHVSDLVAIPDAFVPCIRLTFMGIAVDLTFGLVAGHKVLPPRKSIEEQLLSTEGDAELLRLKLDRQTVRSINGVRAGRRILSTVPDQEVFEALNLLVKRWAKARGVYSNIMGYPGGIAWALLSAHVCVRYPEKRGKGSVRWLFVRFFQIFSTWQWPNPVELCERVLAQSCPMDGEVWNPLDKTKTADAMHLFPVITPVFPCLNACFNVSPSTFRVVKSELARAAVIATEAAAVERLSAGQAGGGGKSAASVVSGASAMDQQMNASDFFGKYSEYLQIDVVANKGSAKRKWLGLVEAMLRQLVQKIEYMDANLFVHPFPNAVQRKACDSFFVGLASCSAAIPLEKSILEGCKGEVAALSTLAASRAQSWLTADMKVVGNVVSRADLPAECGAGEGGGLDRVQAMLSAGDSTAAICESDVASSVSPTLLFVQMKSAEKVAKSDTNQQKAFSQSSANLAREVEALRAQLHDAQDRRKRNVVVDNSAAILSWEQREQDWVAERQELTDSLADYRAELEKTSEKLEKAERKSKAAEGMAAARTRANSKDVTLAPKKDSPPSRSKSKKGDSGRSMAKKAAEDSRAKEKAPKTRARASSGGSDVAVAASLEKSPGARPAVCVGIGIIMLVIIVPTVINAVYRFRDEVRIPHNLAAELAEVQRQRGSASCDSITCLNGGSCFQGVGVALCDCKRGSSGQRCEFLENSLGKPKNRSSCSKGDAQCDAPDALAALAWSKVADTAKTIGSRVRATLFNTNDGHMWLFGGSSSRGNHNDLWKFSTKTKTWTRMWDARKDQVPGPSGRSSAVGWASSDGNELYIFGGQTNLVGGSTENAQDKYTLRKGKADDEFWKFSVLTRSWSLVTSQRSMGEMPLPPARHSAVGWVDKDSDGLTRFWIFGGAGYKDTAADQPKLGPLNDLFYFQPDRPSNGFVKMEPESGASGGPKPRWGASVHRASDRVLWLYGGLGDRDWQQGVGPLADVWKLTFVRAQPFWSYAGQQAAGAAAGSPAGGDDGLDLIFSVSQQQPRLIGKQSWEMVDQNWQKAAATAGSLPQPRAWTARASNRDGLLLYGGAEQSNLLGSRFQDLWLLQDASKQH